MSKYIDAEELIKTLNREGVPFNEDVNHFILHAPAADVQEVKHGRWDDSKVAFYLKCSECGCCVRAFVGEVFLDYAQEWHYCPNCGSRMDLGGDAE